MNKKKEIFLNLQKLALFIGQEQTTERLKAFTEKLSVYDLKTILFGISRASEKFTFFPSYAQLLQFIDPEPSASDKNDFIAGEIIASIRPFGSYQSKKAKEHLGELAWRAVEYMGGWQAICSTDIENIGILRAQLKKAVNASLASNAYKPEQLSSEIKQNVKKLDYSEFTSLE
jgi:hypothetical protein